MMISSKVAEKFADFFFDAGKVMFGGVIVVGLFSEKSGLGIVIASIVLLFSLGVGVIFIKISEKRSEK